MVEAPKEVPRILVACSLAEEHLERLKEKGWAVDYLPKVTQDELPNIIPSYDGLIVRSDKDVTKEVFEKAIKLRVVGRAGVGTDNIDVDFATQRGILVFNTPGGDTAGNTESAAEHAIALMLAHTRHIPQAHGTIINGGWGKENFTGRELREKTIGIVGFGHVGSRVAEIARDGLKMKVIVHDPIMTEERAELIRVQLVPSLEELLSRSDVISLHVPSNDKTKHMINKRTLGFVKPDAIIVNTARGEIIDNEALEEALKNGTLGGAALDVFDPYEPNVPENIRSLREKVTLTPHLAASTIEAQDNVSGEVTTGMIDALEGRIPDGAVNLPEILPEVYRQLAPYLPVAKSVAELAMWIAEGKRVKQIEAHFIGGISKFDLRPLRAAMIRGFVSPFSDPLVNIVNYRDIEKQRGLRVKEIIEETEDTNGFYSNLIKICLVHEGGGETSISGVPTHEGPTAIPRIVKVNGYPIGFDIVGKPMLICINRDEPGMINEVTAVFRKYNINVETWCGGKHPSGDGTAMMQYSLDRALEEEALKAIRDIKGISLAIQVKI